MRPLNTLLTISLCLAMLFSQAALSDELRLTEKELKEYAAELTKIRKQSKEYRMIVLSIQMALGAFGFGTGPFDGVLDTKTQAAIKKYQRIRNLRQTGEIDARTALTINHDFETWNAEPVILPGLHVFLDFWDRGYVNAKGTWTIVGEQSGLPMQTTELQCDKLNGYCISSTALFHGKVLSVDQNRYPIERWDKHEILTKPDESAACVRYTIRIGRLEKSVTGLRLRTSDEAFCKGLSPEINLKLVNGWEIQKQLMEKRNAKLKGLPQVQGFE